jgi:BolA family transcriptional regulator, general stress-responsive regulator
MNAQDMDTKLRTALAPDSLVVTDDSHLHAGHAGAADGSHFSVHITARCFSGLSRVARHRLVYDSLGPLAQQRVHALALVTKAPGEV